MESLASSKKVSECNFNAEKDHIDLSKYKSDTPQITQSYKSEISKDEVGFRIFKKNSYIFLN